MAKTPGNTSENRRQEGGAATPRRLRLSEILIELGARAGVLCCEKCGEELAARPESGKCPKCSEVVSAVADKRSDLALGAILDRTAHAGFGFLVALLALVSLPFVGLSTPFGLAIAFIGVQMIAGRAAPWLPGFLRRHVVAMTTLDWISHRVARWTGWLERWIKPRWVVLTRGPMWVAIGVGIVLLGLGLALPLPIPGSNAIFLVPIVLYAIGLLEDDGALVLVGHVGMIVDLFLCMLFYEAIRHALIKSFAWVAGW